MKDQAWGLGLAGLGVWLQRRNPVVRAISTEFSGQKFPVFWSRKTENFPRSGKMAHFWGQNGVSRDWVVSKNLGKYLQIFPDPQVPFSVLAENGQKLKKSHSCDTIKNFFLIFVMGLI